MYFFFFDELHYDLQLTINFELLKVNKMTSLEI